MTLSVRSAAAPALPQPGRYRHFKGGDYELLSVATHTETNEPLVVYRSVTEPHRVWVRPLAMFLDVVEGPAGVCRRFEPASGSPTATRIRTRLQDIAASAAALTTMGRSPRRQ
jgi:hypothetical protein